MTTGEPCGGFRKTTAAVRHFPACSGWNPRRKFRHQSMFRKSGNRFSEKIMLKQRDQIMIRCNLIGS
jgi:hypothetical protein